MKALWICALTLILLTKGSEAQEDSITPPERTLYVHVHNATPEGQPPVGNPVHVNIYQGESLVKTLNGTVNSQSLAIFSDLPDGDNLNAIALCEHQQVQFQSSPAILSSTKSQTNLQVRVYDVSTDIAGLSLSNHHIILKLQENQLLVNEYLRLENSSTRAIKPTYSNRVNTPAGLNISLPRGYKNFQSYSYFLASSLVFSEKGFVDPLAVAPGTYDINFSYNLEIPGKTVSFSRESSLPTDNFVVYVALPQIDIQGLGEYNDVTLPEGTPAQYYALGAREAGEVLSFDLTGFKLKKSDKMWLILPIIFVVVVAIALRRLKTSNT